VLLLFGFLTHPACDKNKKDEQRKRRQKPWEHRTENGSLLHNTYYSLYEEYSTPEGVLTCEKVPAHVHACDAYLFFIILKT
jgi:hypothetical protein